jgi:hypothetical protein
MPHTDPGTFWNRLFRDVVEAENEHDRLHDQMDRTLQPMDFNGIPPADARYPRRKAQNDLRAAFARYERAKERFRAFTGSG